MGIDVYLRPNILTDGAALSEDDYRPFGIDQGHKGYLREAYHGGPYATQVLVPEAFEWTAHDWPFIEDWPDDLADAVFEGCPIPAARMRERLPAAKEAFDERMAKVYPDSTEAENAEYWKSFVDFVELAERVEKAGYAPRVYASY